MIPTDEEIRHRTERRLNLLWAVVFLAIGMAILVSIPPVASGRFLLVGGAGSAVGVWFLVRFVLLAINEDER